LARLVLAVAYPLGEIIGDFTAGHPLYHSVTPGLPTRTGDMAGPGVGAPVARTGPTPLDMSGVPDGAVAAAAGPAAGAADDHHQGPGGSVPGAVPQRG